MALPTGARRFLTRVTVVTAITLLVATNTPGMASAQSARSVEHANTDPFISLVRTFKTPKALEAYLLANFKYQPDDHDRLKSVRRFMYDRCGDCEDYSLFIGSALAQMGYTVDVVEMHFRRSHEKYDHRVVVYRDRDTGKEHYLQGYPDGFTDGKISAPFSGKPDLIRALESLWEADPGTFSYGFNSVELLVITYGNNPDLGYLP